VEPGAEVSFATVVAAARARDEVAIGYRTVAMTGAETQSPDDAPLRHGVVLNPPLSARLRLDARDRVIVLAD
jgi:hypothetical protein